MTKPEFQDLQKRAAVSGMTLKPFLQDEGTAYSTYNYRCRKMKAETETQPMAPISIVREPHGASGTVMMPDVEVPGVMLAFPNGVKAHFGRGSEGILMEVLSQSMSRHVLP